MLSTVSNSRLEVRPNKNKIRVQLGSFTLRQKQLEGLSLFLSLPFVFEITDAPKITTSFNLRLSVLNIPDRL